MSNGKRVGFIGLGIMGKPMVRNLVKAGYQVVAHSRNAADAAAFAAESDAIDVVGNPAAVPDYYIALGYDVMLLMADAIGRANTTTDRAAVRDALGATQGFKGVDGNYSYDGKGDNTTPTLHLMQLTKDGFVPFTPPQ